MSDSPDQTGEVLGPYHLDKRYEDLDEPGGQLYAAHHVETGCPALVLVPGPGDHWAPRSDWSAHVMSSSEPPFLATALDRPPPPDAEALTDLDLAFIRMAGGVSSVEDREDANADFIRSPRTQKGRTPEARGSARGRTGALVTALVALVAAVLWPCLMSSPEHGNTPKAVLHIESMSWMTRQDGPPAIGYPMPEVAFPEQAKPPCQEAEVEIRGGCWFEGKKEAPCARGTAEYQGKCYVPVHEKKPEPRSVKP